MRDLNVKLSKREIIIFTYGLCYGGAIEIKKQGYFKEYTHNELAEYLFKEVKKYVD